MSFLVVESGGQQAQAALYTAGQELLKAGCVCADQLPLLLKELVGTTSTETPLQRVIVARGPGRYTSLRMGIAAALGIGAGLSIPTQGVGSWLGVADSPRWLGGDAGRTRAYFLRTDLPSRVAEQGMKLVDFEEMESWIATQEPGSVGLLAPAGKLVEWLGLPVFRPTHAELLRASRALPLEPGPVEPVYPQPAAAIPPSLSQRS